MVLIECQAFTTMLKIRSHVFLLKKQKKTLLFQMLMTAEPVYNFILIFTSFLTFLIPSILAVAKIWSKLIYEQQCRSHSKCDSGLAVFSP